MSLLQFAGVVDWIVSNPETGWVIVLAYVVYEIRGRRGRISQLFNEIDKVVIVVRGIARATDGVKTEKVDQFLTQNGNEPGDFVAGADFSKTHVDQIVGNDGSDQEEEESE